ncbi:prominin-1 [Plodia interpunctella]|uniref:prominin-1 n=1 Tax=Plodia interpunctella TaxID=58824 RepID=UPI002368491A|nr:prominin-1 [Plodia interpunctella]
MAAIALIYVILLANCVSPQISRATVKSGDINKLSSDSTEIIFPLQKQEAWTTAETTPADFAGNNLNVDGNAPRGFTELLIDNQFHGPRKSTANSNAEDEKQNKKIFDKNMANNKSDLSLKQTIDNIQTSEPLRLVWDSCLETIIKDNPININKPPVDIDNNNNDYQIEQSNIEEGNIWNKRDANAGTRNNSVAIKAWLDKYNSLKNGKMEERKQQKTESIFIKKVTQPVSSSSTTTDFISTIQVVPITKEIFNKPLDSFDVTQKPVVTENNIAVGYNEDWFEVKDKSKIRFSGLPQKESYLIPALKLDEGFHPFTFMSEFFTLIYPFDFPVGLIKDIVWGKFTFPYSFLQSIRIESTFLGFIIAFASIALVIPSYLLILGILSLFSTSSCDEDTETGALFPDEKGSDCNDRALVVVTLFILLLCCVFLSGMAMSNEQARLAADESRSVVSCACADIASWLAAAARDLHHSLIPPVDLVMHAFREDLHNIESLLGEPIQQAIASESGIDLVFDSLVDIVQESEELSSKIASLRDVSMRAGAMAAAAGDKINDLARQLENLKKYCVAKDAPLCDTINTNSLTLQLKFELILHEQQLLQLRSLGVENLTQAISTAKKEFKMLPSAIASQTVQTRSDVLQDVEARRLAVHSSAKILSDIVRHLTSGLHSVAHRFDTTLGRLQKYEFWRWVVMSACLIMFAIIMLLMLLGMLCGCGRAKDHGKRTLQLSTVWLCFASLVLWTLISTIFLITGHAEVYICHALWDFPQYETLSALLDKPSPLLENKEGIFDTLFRDLNNVTIDVSVSDVLRDCEQDRPAYVVFQLERILDVNKETSYFEWGELQRDLGRLASAIDVSLLKTISDGFSRLLNQMLAVSTVNLAKYRMEYNVPLVGKDLPSLVDQLENIAAQTSDLTTAGRLETLATRTQRLYLSNIKPLEQLRNDVVFKLTELELQLMPFRRKLNISLSHIHTAQYYIDNQGDVIAQKKMSVYVSRLLSHAASWRTHVLVAAGTHAARCKPLFSVYSAARTLLCSKYIASLHGWWVCGFLLGVLWCTALAPLCVKLWRSYNRKQRALEAMTLTNLGSGQQETPTTALCDGSNWNTPGPPPPRSDSW